MPSYFHEFRDADGNEVRAFHDSSDCVNGEEHDWSDARDNEDGSSERVCVKCGMGAMHHGLMTAEDVTPLGKCEGCARGIYTKVDGKVPPLCQRCRNDAAAKFLVEKRTRELRAMYSEEHRRYHTFEHLNDMTRTAEKNHIELSTEQLMAIWFHDCVYRVPRDPDESNEEASAKLAVKWMRDVGLGERFIWTVEHIILDTEDEIPRLRASAAVIDLDLWQLSNDDFWKNEPLIREEFGLLTDEQWLNGRRAFLQKMLARDSIFVSEHATPEMEAAARRNLQTAMQQLERDDDE